MSQKRIENKFQDALEDYASFVDDDQLWSEIESSVPKKKRKRRFLIWFAFGLPILTLVVLGFWSIGNSDNHSNKVDIQSHKVNNERSKASLDDRIKPTTGILPIEPIKNLDNTINVTRNVKVGTPEKAQSNIDVTDESFRNIKSEAKISSWKMRPESNANIDYSRKEIRVQELKTMSISESLMRQTKHDDLELPSKFKRKKRRIKPLKKFKAILGLNYYAGMVNSKKTMSNQDDPYIHLGSDYFSQGLSISYSKFFTPKLYGRVILSADKSYKKLSTKIIRDTLVPSSKGDQIIAYNEYSNGVVDTESGIPIVKGEFSRDVLNLNTMTTLALGVGLGYEQSLGRWNVNIEADIQRTFYYDFSGLGQADSEQKIRTLSSFKNYFSDAPKYFINTQLNVDFALSRSIFLVGGIQNQIGMSSILIDQTNHSEKINLLRGSLGLKKIMR